MMNGSKPSSPSGGGRTWDPVRTWFVPAAVASQDAVEARALDYSRKRQTWIVSSAEPGVS